MQLTPTPSSIVQLSGLAQVLSASASLGSSIQSLQGEARTATPDSVQSAATSFVAAFNQLQGKLGEAAFLSGDGAADNLIENFALSLNAASTAKTDASLASLQAMGIRVEVSTAQGSGQVLLSLQLDPTRLDAAATDDPAGTLRTLGEAAASLLAPITRFEAQASSSASALAGGELSSGELLANLLSSTASTAGTQLITPDISSLAVDSSSGPVARSAAVTATSLADTTRASSVQSTAMTAPAQTSAARTTVNAEPAEARVVADQTELSVAETTDSTAPSPSQTAATQSAAAQGAVRPAMADPALSTQAANPFYAGSVAAYLQNALSPPASAARPLEIELPEPVAAVAAVRAVRGLSA
ncbi:hypothetical protein [Uliginosibacterium sediminicola]|uniref:Flagellar hook-length control protein FliK n=1 Tax=Uliginosibacterium sediminicola TaxID=2024550 RepID=A0ABU9Z1N6_9RHOO